MKIEIQQLAEGGKKDGAAQKIIEETKVWREIKDIILQLIDKKKKEFDLLNQEILTVRKRNSLIYSVVLLLSLTALIGLIYYSHKSYERSMS